MSLVRAWRRAVLGASGVGLLVPVALVAALAVTATVGGTGGLQGLEQVFGGPAVPEASRDTLDRAAREGRSGADVPPVPHASREELARARARARAAAAAGGGADGPAASPDRADRGRSGGERTGVAPGGTVEREGARRRPQPRPAPSPSATQPTRPVPPPEEDAGPVRGIGNAVADTVRQLPTVGEPAGDVVQTIVDLIAPPRSAPSGTTGAPAVTVPAP